MSFGKCTIIGLLSVGLFAGAAHAQETVKLGLIQPLTGSVAYNGTTDVNGSKLAADEINARGGVLGKKLELVIEDGQCRPANSVNAAEKLIQRDKVAALSGAFCSSATLAVMPVAENYKLPLLTGVALVDAVRRHAQPRGRRASIRDHAVDRTRASQCALLRAMLRPGTGVDPARGARWPDGPPQR